MRYINLKAFAKINLALDIVGKDEQGYHMLETVMKTVDLSDSIFTCTEEGISKLAFYADAKTADSLKDIFTKMKATGKKIVVASDNRALPTGEKNLAYKAASLFCEKTGYDREIFIYIVKKIPVGAGLGGGSSDAAAVLKALNNLARFPLEPAELREIASQVGSDVPFFMSARPAYATGRGTEIKRLPDLPPLSIVLVKPSIFSSTAEAYTDYDCTEIPEDAHPDCERLIRNLLKRDVAGAAADMKNVLEYPVFKKYPLLAEIKEEMLSREGVLTAFMTGSGSTIVGLFENSKYAKEAEKHFLGLSHQAFYVT